MSKQLVNLLGTVLVVAILVAGVAIVALPIFKSAQTTEESTRAIAQTNSIYEIQVTQLSAENERIDETNAHLAILRNEIAAIPQLDDVFEIVASAAAETDAAIESIAADDPQPWAKRGALDEATDATSAPATEAAPSPATEVTPTPDADVAPEAETAEQPADTVEQATTAAGGTQQQVVITITVSVEGADAASAFIDALGRGPRLLAPIDGQYNDGKLVATALAFIQTEQ